MRKLFLLLLTAVCISCTKKIEVDFPELEIKPVVNCLFVPGKPFVVQLGLTQKTDDTLKTIVANANVIITDNKGVAYPLKHSGKGQYTASELLAEKGVNYSISVKIPGYNEVTATGSIPDSKTRVTRIKSQSGTRPAPVYGTGDTGMINVEDIDISFFNEMGIEDLMGITILSKVTFYISDDNGSRREELENEIKPCKIFSNELAIQKEGLANFENKTIELFRDEFMDSEHPTLKVAFEKNLKTMYWIRFFRFSPDAFKYTKSWIAHEYTRTYDFWEVFEPEPLYSNIKNGYGIFAGYDWMNYQVIPGTEKFFPQK